MTIPEFLDWAERQAEGRYELVDGRIVAIAPERAQHSRAKSAVYSALRDAIKGAGLPCEAFADGMSVKISDARVREPDASVQCGAIVDTDSLFVPEPIIVVEVLSPSSVVTDTVAKFTEYFSVPSIRHYLIVDTETNTVVHHCRAVGGGIVSRIVTEGTIEFEPPGFAIPLDAVFE